MSVQVLHKDHTYLKCPLDPPNSVHAAECSELLPCWFHHQLLCCTNRVPILSNACNCKYKHNVKLPHNHSQTLHFMFKADHYI